MGSITTLGPHLGGQGGMKQGPGGGINGMPFFTLVGGPQGGAG